ncbi:hypothetical protein VPNG_06663 [Cytospora leucostoma]|uniref:Phosphatidylglycerol/phosphatidylinositol transfer protein n=1 Tax=Cytospora leucostoma TaxID=1230097 RepID=A0A423WTZ1_9PEZI|nr:hypothetical protein VPNG_06663 [Cytospora leucostoma]
MKLITPLIAAGLALGASATALDVRSAAQRECTDANGPVVGDKVPGYNPFLYCDLDNFCNGIASIDYIDFYPMPPQLPGTFTYTATVSFTGTVQQGATIEVIVDVGTQQSFDADLCTQAAEAGDACPISDGSFGIIGNFTLDSSIPHGVYFMYASISAEDQTPIACIQGNIKL